MATLPRTLHALMLAALPWLAGCVNDTASHMIDGDRNHAITLVRAQPWFWDDSVRLSVIVARQPDCLGGMDVESVPRGTDILLHRAPDDYAEPIYILDIAGNHYAVSTLSCRVQKFADKQADPGITVGHFREVDGRLTFTPGQV